MKKPRYAVRLQDLIPYVVICHRLALKEIDERSAHKSLMLECAMTATQARKVIDAIAEYCKGKTRKQIAIEFAL